MVTKVNVQDSLPLSRNFACKGISSGVVSYGGGTISGDGVVKEISAGTVTISSYPYMVYIDTTDGTIKAANQSASPLANAIILYRGNSSSDIEDVRSWTSSEGAITAVPPSFTQTLSGIGPDNHWVLDETGNTTQPVDQGVGGSLSDMTIGNFANIRQGMIGWNPDDPMYYFGPSASMELDSVPTSLSSASTTGAIVFMFKLTQPNITSQRTVLHFGDGSNETIEIYIQGTGSGSKLVCRITSGSGNYYEVVGSANLMDGVDHWVVLQQDGSGIDIYVDGTLDASATNSTAGTGTSADWIDDVGTWSAGACHIGTQSGSTNEFRGYIGNVAYFNGTTLSAGDITSLSDTCPNRFRHEVKALSPDEWLQFDWAAPGGTQPGSYTGGMNPNFNTQPGFSELSYPTHRGDTGGIIMRAGQNPLQATTGISSAAGYGTIIFPLRTGSDGTWIFDNYQGFDANNVTFWSVGSSTVTTYGKGLGWFTSVSTASNTDYQNYFQDTNANDGEWHLVYIIKNNDTNVVDIYIDNTLLVSTFESAEAAQDPDRWMDDFTASFSLGDRGNPSDPDGSPGMLLTDFIYIDGTVLDSTARSTVYTAWNEEKTATAKNKLFGLTAGSIYQMNESSLPLEDLGYGIRYTSSPAASANFDLDSASASAPTYAQDGPIAGLKAFTSTSTTGVRSTDVNLADYESMAQGGVMVTFKGTGNGALYSAGNTGGAYVHEMKVTATGGLNVRLRDGTGSPDVYDIDVDVSGVDLLDDEWHGVVWLGDATEWKVCIDGTWYTSVSGEWTENSQTVYTGANWIGDLADVSRLAFGIQAASDTLGFDGEIGPCAIWGVEKPNEDEIAAFFGYIGVDRS